MPHIPIDPNVEYSPREIKEHGFILNTKGKPDYLYILRLITHGKLPAKNYSYGSKDRKIFKVLGQDIINWKNNTVVYSPEEKVDSPYKFKSPPFPQAEAK